jgi:hypothetical protein
MKSRLITALCGVSALFSSACSRSDVNNLEKPILNQINTSYSDILLEGHCKLVRDNDSSMMPVLIYDPATLGSVSESNIPSPTERKFISVKDKALPRSQYRLHDAFDGTPIGVVRVDAKTCTVFPDGGKGIRSYTLPKL